MKGDIYDPKALVREAYNIEGITAPECRTIFLDWALSLPEDQDTQGAIGVLLARHGVEGHPMTEVLQDGLQKMSTARRRGGWQGRRKS